MRGLRRKSKTGILFGLYTMFLIGANIFEIGAYTFPFKKVKIVGISLKKKKMMYVPHWNHGPAMMCSSSKKPSISWHFDTVFALPTQFLLQS